MPTLSILVPSRGRPHNLKRLCEALKATCTTDYQVLVRLDANDPQLDEYTSYLRDEEQEATEAVTLILTGDRVYFGASMNELAYHAKINGFKYMALLGDDVVPESVGWDARLIELLGDQLGVVYGSDGLEHLHGTDLPTHVVIPTQLYTRLGWVVLPTLRHLFADNVWRELGRGLNNFQYAPEVALRHYHRWNGMAPNDATYEEANNKVKRERDRQAYLDWRDGSGYIEAMEKLNG